MADTIPQTQPQPWALPEQVGVPSQSSPSCSSSPSPSSLPSSSSPAVPAAPLAPPAVTPPATATATRPRPSPAPPKVDRLPPWRVLLHNDDVNDIGYVVETIIELLHANPRQALLCTLTAHRSGLALLVNTHREHAELLLDQFQSKSLTVTIEPEG